MSLRSKQIAAINRMLDLNRVSADDRQWHDPWKVLVYDRFCRDVISPLLKVGDLRKRGITLHLLLESDRDAIPDVPAIYFMLPTQDNIQRLGEDCGKGLYDSYHLNFAHAIPRVLLEELAARTLQSECVGQVGRVMDQYLNFISLQEDMFSLNLHGSYALLNSPTTVDSVIEAFLEQIVNSLFSVLVTMGVVPIMRCPKGGAAQMVAEALEKRLRDNMKQNSNLFSDANSSAGFQRPVLVILDRNLDLAMLLQHAWTYRALCHDLIDMKLNRVTIPEEVEGTGQRRPRTYDLDPTDKFWMAHVGAPFQQVAEDVDAEIGVYKKQMDEINQGGQISMDEDALADSTKHLASALNQLPELQETKRLLDMHTNIATELLNHIKSRSLDSFYSVEESIIGRSLSSQDKGTIKQLLTEGSGTAEDRLRLLCLHYLHSDNTSLAPAELDSLAATLQEGGVDLTAFQYLKKFRAIQNSINAAQGPAPSGQNTVMKNVFGLAEKVGVGDTAKGLGSFIASGVKSLLPSAREAPVTRTVAALMDSKSTSPEEDTFACYDPKMIKTAGGVAPVRNRSSFKEAIVFVIGGGNYLEYQNLQDYANQQQPTPKKIMYGSTEILTSSEFLSQLAEIGKGV